MSVDLSVIVPTHARPQHLARTLQALMDQEGRNFEIVVVADDCGDDTHAVLERASRTATVQFSVIECVERSAARARNRGLAAASGHECLFLDTDILVPSDFTQKVIDASRRHPSAVLLTPLYGNAASSITWPLLVNEDSAIDTLECDDLLRWASHQVKLRDCRVPFADPDTGSLNHLPAPWVFGWSSALAVSRGLIRGVGGFAEAFEVKGSEDIELGIRLSKAGASFYLLLNTYVFHLPHERDRTLEESRDFVHALRLLATHPNLAVEALCAFDCENANPMLELLAPAVAILGDLAQTAARQLARPDVLRLPIPSLIIGPPPSWSDAGSQHARVIYPVSVARAAQLPLFGFALPLEDRTIPVVLITCVWQILPERLACRIFDEALRVSEAVYVLKDSSLAESEVVIPPDRLAVHDTPYWERTHRLRRSFYDFSLEPLGQDGALLSYRLTPT
jgi:GT2 family glycosyltransferase